MNERIRELADQAELTIRTSKGTYMSHPEFNKKFAELIVQECANFVREEYDHEHAEGIAWHMEIKFGLHGDYA